MGLQGSYSGHSFRRTSATFLASQGISAVQLQEFRRWKNMTVAMRYFADSKSNKTELAGKLKNKLNKEKKNKLVNEPQVQHGSKNYLNHEEHKDDNKKGTNNFYFSNCNVTIENVTK